LRAVGWLESEVEALIAHRVAVRRGHNSAQRGLWVIKTPYIRNINDLGISSVGDVSLIFSP
jgi:hypothetical protein